jgi:hypothetical protein
VQVSLLEIDGRLLRELRIEHQDMLDRVLRFGNPAQLPRRRRGCNEAVNDARQIYPLCFSNSLGVYVVK